MKKELIITKDGSHSLFVPSLNETYHSIHGSISEAMHVFIKNGLMYHKKNTVDILEIGFGTGLNTLLTFKNVNHKKIHYTTLEPYPISKKIYTKLNFQDFLDYDNNEFFNMHQSQWEKDVVISDNFTLEKKKISLQNYNIKKMFDIIYFDAFSPEKQPEIWEKEILKKCFRLLNVNGFLVTYCAKGIVKRTLKSVGFNIETLLGPPGKREMIRANQK